MLYNEVVQASAGAPVILSEAFISPAMQVLRLYIKITHMLTAPLFISFYIVKQQ
jgi:hypothetical protein